MMPSFTRNELEIYYSEEVLKARVAELGKQILDDYGADTDIHVISVLKGSFIFLADLVRAIPSDRVTIDFLALSSYGDSTSTSGVVQLTQDLTSPISGRDVLIVEDIIDTGLTMKYLVANLETRKPKSIKVCSLLHKKEREIEHVKLDYVGFEVPDRFVVGYGLDYGQHYRNIPYIAVYNGEL